MVKTCVVCGEEFETSCSRNTCSEKCKKKRHSQRCVIYQRKKREEQKALGIEVPKVKKQKPKRNQKVKWKKPNYNLKKCAYCGKEYVPTSAPQKYCSFSCRHSNAPKYKEAKPLSGLALDNQKAREEELSYGQWRGKKILEEQKIKQKGW